MLCFLWHTGKAHTQLSQSHPFVLPTSIKKIPGDIFITNGGSVKPVSFGFNLRLGAKTNWLQCDLVNSDTLESEAIIELTNPFLKQIKIYSLDSAGKTDSMISGAEYVYIDRPKNHPNFQFPIKIAPGQKVICLIGIEVGNVAGDFKLMIWNKESRNEFQLLETKYLSYFFIINISFLLLIGIAIFITKQRFHWYYFIYALFGFIYIYTEVGLSYKNVWAENPYFQSISILLVADIYQIFGLLFVRKYFNTKFRLPFMTRLLELLILTGLIFELAIIGFGLFQKSIPVWFVFSNTIVFILSGIVVFGVAIFSIWLKYLKFDAIWFMIGFTPHAISILQLCMRPFRLYNTSDEGWFQHLSPIYIDTIHPPNFLLWSVLWESIIVFWLIIKRLRLLFEENNRMTRQLAFQREKNMQTLLTGVEKERQRIAQELHDGSGVALSALKMKLNLLKENTDKKDPYQIVDLMKEVDRIYEDIRNISHNLMPKTLSKLGLYPAIDDLINQFRVAAPQIRFNYYKKTDIIVLNENAKINIFRMMQELLTNIVKHSGAKEVSLQLIKHNDSLMISVEDDGVGFDTRESKNGIGLTSVESRVQMFEGNLSIDSSPQNGTFVSIFLPIKNLK
ncbi:MAG TPA: histidine kinase [Niabella sp.]|nr:histidine kinase [Niabella sp.]HOZ96655.1 histidine kinase [Niabella sp.]HQW14477.1 histidine kinase [Niabella sp.]HQX19892.1 histidine kinase [Niabella sp.]HRB07326.1 histidine kinase [Niabella sp.]